MLPMVSKPAIDVAKLVKHREQLAYEHHLARTQYAYGVDLRRSAWLDRSTLGDPLMRSVDRRWNALVADLTADVLEPGGRTPSNPVMDELLGLVRLLHTPWPSIRMLKPKVAETWPIVTPLGTTKGGSHWLVIDRDRLEALSATERRFLLASGIAHLQCDHGPLFSAHLMAHRGARGAGLVRTLLRPWSRVCMFSADRAGLIAVENLDEGLDALRAHADPGVPWLPPSPELAERTRALEEFSKSRLMTRLRLGTTSTRTLAPRMAQPGQALEDDASNETSEEEHAATKEADLREQAPSANAAKTDDPAKKSEPTANESAGSGVERNDPVAEAERAGEKLAAEQEIEDAARERRENEMAETRAREQALAQAWPLARCDQRLTRRLGLL